MQKWDFLSRKSYVYGNMVRSQKWMRGTSLHSTSWPSLVTCNTASRGKVVPGCDVKSRYEIVIVYRISATKGISQRVTQRYTQDYRGFGPRSFRAYFTNEWCKSCVWRGFRKMYGMHFTLYSFNAIRVPHSCYSGMGQTLRKKSSEEISTIEVCS